MPVFLRIVMLLGTAFAAVTATAAPPPGEPVVANEAPAQIIARLKSADERRLFDRHGNAHEDLQRLMMLRFGATAEVEKHIDQLNDPRDARLRNALFHVLGFVKDPASITWLVEKRRSDAAAFYDRYLPQWRTRYDGYGSWEWLVGRKRWIAFWLGTFRAEPSADRRLALLDVLRQFDDASVIAFFKARRVEATDPKEALLVEAYLDAHDLPIKSERLTWALETLRVAPENTDFLIEVARRLRHEAFVPFLVGVADRPERNVFPSRYPAEHALRAITLQCDLQGKSAWQSWQAEHGTEGRAAWLRSAMDALKAELAADPKLAAERFAKFASYWGDIAVLPFVESALAPHAEFHGAIASWINVTYSDFRRERLRPLAERMGAGGQPGDWARKLLQERGYVPGGRKETWVQVVENANLVI